MTRVFILNFIVNKILFYNTKEDSWKNNLRISDIDLFLSSRPLKYPNFYFRWNSLIDSVMKTSNIREVYQVRLNIIIIKLSKRTTCSRKIYVIFIYLSFCFCIFMFR